MAKNNSERRTKVEKILHYDRRKADKITATYVLTKSDERYQFEHLVLYYRASFNVWQVMNMNLPSYEQLLHEVTGYANQADAFIWAKDYVKAKKVKEWIDSTPETFCSSKETEKKRGKRVSRTKSNKRS